MSKNNQIITAEALSQICIESCILEANMLSTVINSIHFSDAASFLTRHQSKHNHIEPLTVQHWNETSSIIDASTLDPHLHKIFSASFIASSCYLFSGLQLHNTQINSNHLTDYARQYATKFIASGQPGVRSLAHRLHNADAIRTVQLLKYMDLLDIDQTSTRQLSLGAGHGSRELCSMHLRPKLTMDYIAGGKTSNCSSGQINFDAHVTPPNDIVLIDNDQGYNDYYKELNSNNNGHITALNMDTNDGLVELRELIEAGSRKIRNLITAFRIDHRMIGSATNFLSILVPVLERESDLIISIGAGFSEEEFAGRLNKLEEIYNALNTYDLNPVMIKLYKGGTIQEKRNNRAFGSLHFATYAILYCKIFKDKLEL